MLPHDIEIVRILAESGPATTGDIVSALTVDLTPMAVRERLWVLMGLDNIIEEREQSLVDRDVESGEWGLPGQVDTSARGRIPDDPQTLLQRIEDEYVRQALERGCDRVAVADVLGVARRTTFYKEKRAHAYDFPLSALENRGGRPPKGSTTDHGTVDTQARLDQAGQQRLDAVADEAGTSLAPAGADDGHSDGAEPAAQTSGRASADGTDAAVLAADDGTVIRDHVQQAIAALERLDAVI